MIINFIIIIHLQLGLYLDIQVLGMLANNIFIENITVRTMARAIQVDHTVVAVGKLATYHNNILNLNNALIVLGLYLEI